MRIKRVILLIIFSCCLDIDHTFAAEGDVAQNIRKLLDTKSCIGCNLTGADLLRAKLNGASLQNSILDGARFCLSVLTNADFKGASLQNVKFCGADISGANFIDADLTNASFDGVYDRGTVYKRQENNEIQKNTDSLSDNRQKNSIEAEKDDARTTTIRSIKSINAPPKKIIRQMDPIKIGM